MKDAIKYKIYHYPLIGQMQVCFNSFFDSINSEHIAIQTDDKKAFNDQLQKSLNIVFEDEEYFFVDKGDYILFYSKSKRTLDQIVDDNN